MKFQGLRSLIYPTSDIKADTAWWREVLGQDPNFESDDYVGFTVAGYEIGLFAHAKSADGAITYLGVEDVKIAYAELLESHDATSYEKPVDVGGGITMASVKHADGQILGLIHNPNFALPPQED